MTFGLIEIERFEKLQNRMSGDDDEDDDLEEDDQTQNTNEHIDPRKKNLPTSSGE